MSRKKTGARRRNTPKKLTVPTNVPTVRERLEHIGRAFTLVGLALGFGHARNDYDRDRSVHLDLISIDALRSVIWDANSDTWWLQRLDDKVLDQLAPSDDQVRALETAGSAR